MKRKVVHWSITAASVALLLAACGGGGGGGSAADASTLQLSGTAAVGAALAGANVEVKCGTGTGTATTTSSGGYTVSMSGGALPCIVRVTGTTADGGSVTLHSVVETGTTSGSSTAAVANVTPITEMIVAQLMEALPADAFTSFTAQSVTQTALAAATTTIVDALKTAGVDLGGIDPLKATLVPASGTTAGNTYDQLLDQLGQSVTPEALPLLVSQIATSAASDSSTGLTDAMTAVSSGALEGCPVALSGKYRTVDYNGAVQVHMIDFKAGTLATEGGDSVAFTASSTPCQISVGDSSILFSASGVGAIHGPDTVGYAFPVQSHTLSAVLGTWNFVESGFNESNAGEHFFGKFTFNADGSAGVCDYDVANGLASFTTCNPETQESISVQAAADGSFNLQYGADSSKLYGYKAPNGTLTLFGSSNPAGTKANTELRTHVVMTKLQASTLPAVGTVTKYWDIVLRYPGSVTVEPLLATSNTVTANDAAAGTFTRVRESDGREDTMKINTPVDGMRFRAPASQVASVFQVPVPGVGLAITFNNQGGHLYGISVVRP